MPSNRKLEIIKTETTPTGITPDTIYYVRQNGKVKQFMSDKDGILLYPVNNGIDSSNVSIMQVSVTTNSLLTLVYTVPTGKCIVDGVNFVVNNLDTTPDNLTIAYVPSGQSPQSEHYIILNQSIPTNTIPNASFHLNHFLNEGDKIYISSTDASLNVFISSYVVSIPT